MLVMHNFRENKVRAYSDQDMTCLTERKLSTLHVFRKRANLASGKQAGRIWFNKPVKNVSLSRA